MSTWVSHQVEDYRYGAGLPSELSSFNISFAFTCQAIKSTKLNDLEMTALAIDVVRPRFSRL